MANEGFRMKSRNRSAVRSFMKTVMPVLPSSGGTGSKLNVPSSRFSKKRMLVNVDMGEHMAGGDWCRRRKK